eukprot:EG_transcript_9558
MEGSVFNMAVVAVAAGASVALLLSASAPPLQQYSSTAARAGISRTLPLSAVLPQASSSLPATQGPIPQMPAEAVVANPAGNTILKLPVVLAASGFLFFVAMAVRIFHAAALAQRPTYSMLLTSGARAERERRQADKEVSKQREIQERLSRLSSLGLLPADHPLKSPTAVILPSSPPKPQPTKSSSSYGYASGTVVNPRSEKYKEEVRKREVEERLARLARMGFSTPASSTSASFKKAPPANLTMHVYDHCPYCIRVELFLGWNGVKYNRVVYGYGDLEGPKALIGKKQLPILTGDGAPYPSGMRGLPESMDMINWLSKDFGLSVAPASGRKDYSDWQKKAKNTIAGLMRPRLLTVPFRDFKTKQDVDYATAKWAKKGFSVEQSWANTPQLLAEMERLLWELEPMLKGDASLNAGGLSMDDIFLLPDLRRLTVVRDLKWPSRVRRYVDKALDYPAMQCVPYTPWAL